MRYAHHLSGLLRRMGRCEAAVAISERRNALAAQTGGLDAGVQLPAGWNAWRRLVRRASRPWPLLHAAAVDDAAMLVLRGKGTTLGPASRDARAFPAREQSCLGPSEAGGRMPCRAVVRLSSICWRLPAGGQALAAP